MATRKVLSVVDYLCFLNLMIEELKIMLEKKHIFFQAQ